MTPTGKTIGRFAVSTAVLMVLFSGPLFQLTRLSLGSELYSHILLIPAISLYIVWTRRKSLPPAAPPDWVTTAIAGLLGSAALGYRWLGFPNGAGDALTFSALAFFAFQLALGGWALGRPLMRALMFPFGFLIFIVPFPSSILIQIETFLQHGSALAARALFDLIGSTYFYQNLVFQLPGINLQVAPECSGIRSTLALFVTSLVVGQFFLRSNWNRAILTLFIIPVALVRNGLRIATIGELCVRIGPEMIDSYIHRHGGPIFFAMSLVPLFILLYFLIRWERRGIMPSN